MLTERFLINFKLKLKSCKFDYLPSPSYRRQYSQRPGGWWRPQPREGRHYPHSGLFPVELKRGHGLTSPEPASVVSAHDAPTSATTAKRVFWVRVPGQAWDQTCDKMRIHDRKCVTHHKVDTETVTDIPDVRQSPPRGVVAASNKRGPPLPSLWPITAITAVELKRPWTNVTRAIVSR